MVGREVHWRMVTLSEHYPMSGGGRIRIVTRGAMLPQALVFTANSSPVEISVKDDRMSRLATLREAMQAEVPASSTLAGTKLPTQQ